MGRDDDNDDDDADDAVNDDEIRSHEKDVILIGKVTSEMSSVWFRQKRKKKRKKMTNRGDWNFDYDDGYFFQQRLTFEF